METAIRVRVEYQKAFDVEKAKELWEKCKKVRPIDPEDMLSIVEDSLMKGLYLDADRKLPVSIFSVHPDFVELDEEGIPRGDLPQIYFMLLDALDLVYPDLDQESRISEGKRLKEEYAVRRKISIEK